MSEQDLAQLDLFKGFSHAELELFGSIMERCNHRKDEVIFEQGQPSDYLYILTAGEVLIRHKPYDGPPLTVARVQPGGVFGWSAILRRGHYTSGTVAVSESRSLRLRGLQLDNLCDKFPDTGIIFLERLAEVIAERLRNTHGEVFTMLSQGLNENGRWKRRIGYNGSTESKLLYRRTNAGPHRSA